MQKPVMSLLPPWDAMVIALKDPATRVTRSPGGQFEGSVFNVKKDEPRGVTVVRLERADVARASGACQ
jgi:hypothetical protein